LLLVLRRPCGDGLKLTGLFVAVGDLGLYIKYNFNNNFYIMIKFLYKTQPNHAFNIKNI
jgi:hypothetical protein